MNVNNYMNGLTKDSKVSIGLAVTILAAVVAVWGTFTTMQTEQENIQERVAEIEEDYVPRKEIEAKLQSINSKLDSLLKDKYGKQP